MDYVMSSLGAPRSGTTQNESKAGEEEDVVTKDGGSWHGCLCSIGIFGTAGGILVQGVDGDPESLASRLFGGWARSGVP